jgi:excisionase family DNA binding protein
MRTASNLILDCERPNRTDVEVAQYLGVSVSTVRRWRLTGGGPRWVRICGSVRYPFADLEAYLASLPSGGGTPAEAR